ncbi:hypothetical protein [Cellulomonas soli]
MHTVVTALGWVGAVLCLAAYLLVSTGRWQAGSGRYQAGQRRQRAAHGRGRRRRRRVAVRGDQRRVGRRRADHLPGARAWSTTEGRRRRRRTRARDRRTPRRAALTQPTAPKGNDWTTRAPDRRAHDVDAA